MLAPVFEMPLPSFIKAAVTMVFVLFHFALPLSFHFLSSKGPATHHSAV